jgi:hypothetical protein
LDFFLTIKEHVNNLGTVLKSLIEEEVEISNVLESTIFGHKKYDFFRTNIEFKNFKQ